MFIFEPQIFLTMKFILTIIAFLSVSILFAQNVPAKYQKLWQEVNESDPEVIREEILKKLKKEPNDGWLNWLAGETNEHMDPEAARMYYEKAISVDSTVGAAYYSLASFLDESTEIDRCIYLFTKAIKFDPQLGFSYIYRGQLYLQKGLSDLAMADAVASKKCEMTDPLTADGLIIEILNADGKTKELHEFIQKGKYSDNEMIWNSRTNEIIIRVYEELNQPEDVCKMCRMIQETAAMLEAKTPAEILEKLKKCN